MTQSSSRGLIRSMLITGSSQVINILISIVRVKVLAVLLGPAGIGLLGIYTNIQSTASTAAGLGIGSSAVRQIAVTKGDETALSQVRTVLFAGTILQGLVAMALVWMLRAPLARYLIGDEAQATEVGLVGVAVLFTLLASSQTALLRGMRRIGDLAKVTIAGAVAGTVLGLTAVWLEGAAGLIWFVIVQPVAAVVVALAYTRRLPKRTSARLSATRIWQVWHPMATLGVVFMLGNLATTGTLLVVRGRIASDLGLDAAGLFSASWGIAMQYVGFLLGAMSADYFPRLSEIISDRVAANRLMNDQSQLCLALGGPILLLLVGLAPWIMTLLYSREFAPAAEMLQWQAVGNVFKLASWPLGFAFAAAARSRLFLGTELSWNAFFLAPIWICLPFFGLETAGVAFLIAYVLYFALVAKLLRQLFAFRWEPLSLWLIGIHSVLALALLALARIAPSVAIVACILLAAVTGFVGLRIVVTKIGPHGRVASRIASVYRALGWPLETDR